MVRQRKSQPDHLRRYPYPWILAAVVIVVNLNAFQNGFTLDDRTLLVEDPRIGSLSHLGEIFGEGYRAGRVNSLYRPLTVLSFALNRAVTGPEPWGFHAVNIGLHLAAILLFFWVSREVLSSRFLAFVAALLFATHPVHVEAVANGVGRAEILVAGSVLGGLLLFLHQRRAGRSGRTWCGILLLFAAGLLSKESAVVFVGLWVLFSYYYSQEKSYHARLLAVISDYQLWALVAVTLAYLWVRHLVLGSVAQAVQPEITFVENPLAFSSTSTRILTGVSVLGRYIGLLVWPFRLSADYSYSAIPVISEVFAPPFLLSLVLLLALGVVALALVRKRPVYALSYCFFLVSISVVSNLVVPIGATMAERFLYLPSVAFCWAVAPAFSHAGGTAASESLGAGPRRWALVALACVTVPWGVRSFLRNAEWKEDQTLFQSAVQAMPRSAKARLLLADDHFRRGDYVAAERLYQEALEIYPEYAAAAINLAGAYDAVGRYREAVGLLSKFEGRCGSFEAARFKELGRAYIGLQDYPAAAAAYESALTGMEQDALAHRNLGGIYIQYLNRLEDGRRHIRRSLEIDPNQPGAQQMRSLLKY